MQQLALGRTYRVTFKPEFSRHGHQPDVVNPVYLHDGKGVVKVEAMMSFNDIVTSGIKLYDSFFKPCGITEEEYQVYFGTGVPTNRQQIVDPETNEVTQEAMNFTSTVNYSAYPIYKLVDAMNPKDVFYAPEQALAAFPEVDINLFLKLMLTIDLGAWKSPDQLTTIRDVIRERLNLFGISGDCVGLSVYDQVYMDTATYEDLVATRVPTATYSVTITDENKTLYLGEALVPSSGDVVILDVTNIETYVGSTVNLLDSKSNHDYYLQWKRVHAENVQLRAKIAADEELIKQLAGLQ